MCQSGASSVISVIMYVSERGGRATAVGVPEVPPFGPYFRAVIRHAASQSGQCWPKKEFTARNGIQLMSELMSEDD